MDVTEPEISAVICTWNRTAQLRDALESFSKQTLSPSRWNLTVVCNNSPEDTRRVVTEAQSKYNYRLILIDEPRPGKSFALNAAIAAARGRIIACTDDDCQPAPDWLERVLRRFEDPDVALLGGAGISVFQPEVTADPRRRFLARRFLGDYRPYGSFVEIGDRNPPYGLNLSFRAGVPRRIGGFNTALGIEGPRHFGREETDFVRRAQAAGFRVFFDPDAVVYHHVQSERVSWDSVRSEAFDGGVGAYIERYHKHAGSRAARLRLALRFILQYCNASARALLLIGSYRGRTVARFRMTAAQGKLAALRAMRPR